MDFAQIPKVRHSREIGNPFSLVAENQSQDGFPLSRE
jgi:hypothetical protein